MQKNKNNMVYKTFTYCILLLCSACNKYLDKKSNNSLIIPSTLSDAQALLDGTSVMNQQSTACYGEASCDEYFLKEADFNSLTPALKAVYTRVYYPIEFGNDWNVCYQPVYNANLALDLLKEISRSDKNASAWDNVKGSALFFRSYYFLSLLWTYAKAYDSATANTDLGIALRMTSDFNVPSTRASNQQCYEQVISDTKASITLLPDYPLHVMRPSKGSAYGLLARCYLSMRDYKNALLYSDSCLQLNNQLMDYNGDPDIQGLSASYTFKQFNKETIFYTEMSSFFSIYKTNSKGRIDTLLYNSYDSDDLRKACFFKMNADGYEQFKGSYTGSLVCFSGIAVDEMYLIRAECNIRMGHIQEGQEDLNTLMYKRIRTGVFQPYVFTTQENALKEVLLEREKELVMRGMRWIDIKRLNKEGDDIVLERNIDGQIYTLQPNADFYALPLPDDIIKLTGMLQNPY